MFLNIVVLQVTFRPQNSIIKHQTKRNKMKKYLTEFIGTFFLVLTAVLVSNNPSLAAMAPLAVAGIYLAMIYSGGAISGAHFNPAVTMAALILKKLDRTDALYNIIAQLIAGVMAAAIGVYLHDCGGGLDIVSRVNEQAICAIFGEFLGTFGLVYVILNVQSNQKGEAGGTQGLAIGFSFMALQVALGKLSGGAFNPALAVGESVAGMFAWGDFYVYLIGDLMGAAAAATVVQLLEGLKEDTL